MAKKPEVYRNLIQASQTKADYGQKIVIEPAEPFKAQNAKGIIAPMDKNMIQKRAKAFALRCKQLAA